MTEREKYVKWFSELNKNSINEAGEKASFLSELYNQKTLSNKASVPAGFVITKKAISEYLENSNIKNSLRNIFEELNLDNKEEVESALFQAKKLILNTEIPEEIQTEIIEAYDNLGENELDLREGAAYEILSNSAEPGFVAVRSSSDNELGKSHFNIKGKTSLIDAIKKVLISFFDENIIKKAEREPWHIDTAIIVQKMIQSEKSGTVYIGDEVKIKSIWGLGKGLKESEIGKDEYLLRRDGRVLNKKIKEKKYAITRDSSGSPKAVYLKEGYSLGQVLTEGELQELADISLRIEGLIGKKTQFDFAIEENHIYIVKIKNLEETQTQEKEEPEVATTDKINEEIEPEKEELIEEEIIDEKENEEIKEKKLEILPPVDLEKTKIDLLISSTKDSENSEKTNLKTGLITIENIISIRGLHPKSYIENFNSKGYEEVIHSGLIEYSKNLESVWVKLSSLSDEEEKKLEGSPDKKSKNPLMSLRGIKYLLTEPELLKRELRAISKLKETNKEIGLLIPMISSVYELKKVKEFLGDTDSKIKIGLMLETPASIQLIKDFIDEGIDAVVFNGDLLSQYLLAIDKEDEDAKRFYDDTNPALMYQTEYIIRVCKRKGIRTSFLGNALNKKEMINYLVKKEISSIIVLPELVHDISKEIQEIEKILYEENRPRQYEVNKEKERQEKELKAFEEIKDEQVKSDVKTINEISEPKEKLEEKEELENIDYEEIELPNDINKKEINSLEDQNENKELVSDEIISSYPEAEEVEELKEHPNEQFNTAPEDIENLDEEIENIDNLDENQSPNSEEIENINDIFLEGDKKDEPSPKDTLGIF